MTTVVQDQLLSKAAEGATLLIALQFGSRALTFAVNQFLLRYLSPERLAIATQLEVYSISVLFFARESLRIAIQRQPDVLEKSAEEDQRTKTWSNGILNARTAAGKAQVVVNLAHLPVFLGVVFAAILAWLYMASLGTGDPTLLNTPYFSKSLLFYGLAAIWELLSEPCFAVVQQKSQYRTRAATETIATLARCFVTCSTAVWSVQTGIDMGVLPLALGQAMYALVLSLAYYCTFWSTSAKYGFSLLPRRLASEYFHPATLSW